MHQYTKSLLMAALSASLVACASVDNTQTERAASSNNNVSIITPEMAKTPEQGTLSLEKIMSDPDWLGRQPVGAYWRLDGNAVLYSRKQEGSPLYDLYEKELQDNGNGDVVALKNLHVKDYGNGVFNRDKRLYAWEFEGNVFFKDVKTGLVRQLTKDNRNAHSLAFLQDGRISYHLNDAIMAVNPATGLVEKLVSWKYQEAPKAVEPPRDYIAQEQQKLMRVVAKKRSDAEKRFEREKALSASNESMAPDDFYLPKNHRTVASSLSPNGKWAVVVSEEDTPWRGDEDIMPNYIGEDGRIKAEKVRRRVAETEPQSNQVWLLNLASGEQKELSYTVLPGYNEDVLAAVKKENAEANGETYTTNRLPRDIGLMQDWGWSQNAIQWNRNGDQVAIMLEAWDNKDRWIATVDFDKKEFVPQHRLHDDAWVNYTFNEFGWLNNSDQLYFLSEQSGYSHIYLLSPGQKERQLTAGKFEVSELTLGDADQYIYFKGNKKHPGIYEIYRVNIASGNVEQLTDLNGMTDYVLSPDQSKLLLTHSKLTMPPELYVKSVSASKAQKITNTVSDEFTSIDWVEPQIVPVPSSHTNEPVYARVYLPENYLQGDKNKAVVFSHGAGYLQNVHLGWSGYFREFMFHSFLVSQGYVVMDMDYRASKGYGRDWRTAIYRHMGKVEVEDLQDGVKWLGENANVDTARVGHYGGSYGGFITFMAMFTDPDLFQAGAALRPVSDWAHYNHGYTSNILNTPDIDPIAYERSSPIYFAEGLNEPLLMNAPMVDDNVFFVDVVRLVQRLIELEKEDFETAIYPVEAHGFVQPSSWLDEYRRIYKLFETNL
ncbi:prolyl oligopeptidase family serine peptidase [Aestuariibacter sp. AA17]|uniref:Prolyl oligopeptidase family serine peptidase n=1 Tax=Fluctibacter corallii TaxID=2984329 RepID=A0ABT3A9X3_9ALTE|nr:prolyl oligopeptidase family serine peptidase [Aestuariibacter sp. AA17]MCV2885377.1 prolyl oligopeptidase family serine peptidase [Aestuariibacter sp. AA17]